MKIENLPKNASRLKAIFADASWYVECFDRWIRSETPTDDREVLDSLRELQKSVEKAGAKLVSDAMPRYITVKNIIVEGRK